MTELQLFENPEFGKVRTFTEPDGTVLFCGTDIAKALGYNEPHKAVARHCPHGMKRTIGVETGKKSDGSPSRQMISMTFIPQGDVYRLMYKAADQSTNPEIKERAERFGGWIFDEVLPSIQETGSYTIRGQNSQEIIEALNEMVKLVMPVLERAGMAPEYQALAMKQIYRKAGVELPVESLKSERSLYDIGTLAKQAGVFSTAGKPHVQAVGCILRKLEIPDSEKELVSFEKNGHMGTTYQYTAKVADMVKNWLKEQEFPETISENGKNYKVSYDDGRKEAC